MHTFTKRARKIAACAALTASTSAGFVALSTSPAAAEDPASLVGVAIQDGKANLVYERANGVLVMRPI